MSTGNTCIFSNYFMLFEQVQDYSISMMDPEEVIQDWNLGALSRAGSLPQIVQMHEAQISVKSEAGNGCTFYFSLPEKPPAMGGNCCP